MEKKREFFFPKLNLLILTSSLFHGLSHGFHVNQAGALEALLDAKLQAKSTPAAEEWVMPTSLKGQASSVAGNMEDDLITSGLPGQPSTVNFKQYAGYINVDESRGRSLFYYFVEAVENPSSKPLVLWLNGGPGCSSLGVGAMTELGPFGVKPDGKTLYAREFAWNRVANVLFLESPAGVGFSYSNSTSDYTHSGDKRTAKDAYTFLVNWFRRYPQYKARDFYMTGESYAGFYIPELANIIIKKNVNKGSSLKIQLKGIMIGNGIMNYQTDMRGRFDYRWSHALISDETHKGLSENCMNNFFGNKCTNFRTRARLEIGDIDFYNIYAPKCSSPSITQKPRKVPEGYDPCEGNYVDTYLNLPQVQQAFHANITKLTYPWAVCSIVIPEWKDSPSTMFPIYRRLIAYGIRILLYSGDVDAVVPVTSTRYSIDALKIKVIKSWHPWLDETEDVAGYIERYEGLTFATVRGAGHEVPAFQPRRALALLNMFLANLY